VWSNHHYEYDKRRRIILRVAIAFVVGMALVGAFLGGKGVGKGSALGEMTMTALSMTVTPSPTAVPTETPVSIIPPAKQPEGFYVITPVKLICLS
jgi:hypothetical protein